MGVGMVNFDVVRRAVFADLIVVEFGAMTVDRNRVRYINVL